MDFLTNMIFFMMRKVKTSEKISDLLKVTANGNETVIRVLFQNLVFFPEANCSSNLAEMKKNKKQFLAKCEQGCSSWIKTPAQGS